MISNKKTGQTAVLACVENEKHQIGLKMVSDIFDKNGWNTFYIGAGVPVEDLIWFIKEKTPDVLALSISLTYNTQYLEQAIQKIHALFPNQLILIGGLGLWKGMGELLQDGKKIHYIPDLYVLEMFFAK
jgi:MerR family transcriptional regulator, light-induced transcriptional regulator